jgi:hypothetical protein
MTKFVYGHNLRFFRLSRHFLIYIAKAMEIKNNAGKRKKINGAIQI